MRVFFLGLIILFCTTTFLLSGELISVQFPEELKMTYDKFVKAMQSGDPGNINQYCLPQSINFTYEVRKNPEYGQDLNVGFAKNNFDGIIASVRKDAKNCYLIRTPTTALWFVETKSMGWKLYRYLDKPIE